MFQALGCLVRSTAFNAKDDVAWASVFDGLYDPVPVQHALAASATDGYARNFAAFRSGMLDRNVLGMQVHQPLDHAIQPRIHILPGQVRIARVEVDANGRRLDQVVDAVEAVWRPRVLSVGLQADLDTAPFGHEGGFLERVLDQSAFRPTCTAPMDRLLFAALISPLADQPLF